MSPCWSSCQLTWPGAASHARHVELNFLFMAQPGHVGHVPETAHQVAYEASLLPSGGDRASGSTVHAAGIRLNAQRGHVAQVLDKNSLQQKQILFPSSGIALPGEMVALVGPSGAGKNPSSSSPAVLGASCMPAKACFAAVRRP
jgi:hypothetical protein